MNKKMESVLLTPDELSDILHVSRKFVEKYIAAKRLPGAIKIGRVWRFNKLEVEKRLNAGEFLLPEINRKNGGKTV